MSGRSSPVADCGVLLHTARMSAQVITKFLVSAAVITVVSEIAKQRNALGALVGSLPWTTMLILIWLHLEKAPEQKIGDHSFYTFWYVIPTLPMFLAIPWLLRKGVGFWPVLGIYAAGTFALFLLTQKIAGHFGLKL
jgi:hypothetical protein